MSNALFLALYYEKNIKYSPEVKTAVDDIIPTIIEQYEIIGILPNIYNARPDWLKDGNNFIIRKK